MPDTTYIDNATAQMRKGVLEFCVLLVISKHEAYASDILNQLKQFKLLVVEGTLYPILSRLNSAGLVSYTWAESPEGPPRKYYKLTAQGKQTVELLGETYKNLNQSITQLIKNHE